MSSGSGRSNLVDGSGASWAICCCFFFFSSFSFFFFSVFLFVFSSACFLFWASAMASFARSARLQGRGWPLRPRSFRDDSGASCVRARAPTRVLGSDDA
jgi:hypothetical protein